MFSKTKQHKSRNRWLCIWRSINIQTTVGALNTWQHIYHTYLNNFKLIALIITMLNKIIKTKYYYSLLRTPVTILHSGMQNDKCEYLNIYITITHFRNVNEIRLINIAKLCYCCQRATQPYLPVGGGSRISPLLKTSGRCLLTMCSY